MSEANAGKNPGIAAPKCVFAFCVHREAALL